MYTGLLKHGFRVMSSWGLKKTFKMTTLNFHGGIAGDRLLGPYLLPPRLTGVVYHNIPRSVLPELLQGVDLQTEIQLMVRTWWRCTKFFSCISGSFAQRVSGTLDRTKWTNSMAGSFPCFKSLRFSSQETSKVYCLCSRSQWCPGLATTNTEWIWDDSYDTWNIPASYAIGVQTCNVEAQVEHSEHCL